MHQHCLLPLLITICLLPRVSVFCLLTTIGSDNGMVKAMVVTLGRGRRQCATDNDSASCQPMHGTCSHFWLQAFILVTLYASNFGTMVASSSTLRSAHCALHIALCMHSGRGLHIALCTLHIALCTLRSAHGALHIALCTLRSAHCALHIALCALLSCLNLDYKTIENLTFS